MKMRILEHYRNSWKIIIVMLIGFMTFATAVRVYGDEVTAMQIEAYGTDLAGRSVEMEARFCKVDNYWVKRWIWPPTIQYPQESQWFPLESQHIGFFVYDKKGDLFQFCFAEKRIFGEMLLSMKEGDPLRLFGIVYRCGKFHILFVNDIKVKSQIKESEVHVPKLIDFRKEEEMKVDSRKHVEHRKKPDIINKRLVIKEVKSEDRRKQEVMERVEVYTKNIEINPYDATIYLKRGDAYLSLDNYDLAINDYSKAIELDPKYGEAFYQRARAYHNKNDCEKCLQDIAQAGKLGVEVDPGFINEVQKSSRRSTTK